MTIDLYNLFFIFFFFNDTATTEIYTLSLHDALPIRLSSCSASTAEPPVCPCGKRPDRKSTRLNSSHEWISYAVFCLKKKTKIEAGQLELNPETVNLAPLLEDVIGTARQLAEQHKNLLFFESIRKPPRFTLFPYTTLFR